MAGEDVRLGPFVGGLNTISDATAVADTELTQLVNFELDIDGSLVNRPPLTSVGVNFPLDTTGNMKVLGYFVTTTGAPYLLASDGKNSTYYFTGGAWVLLTNTFAASAMCQFINKAWLVAPVDSVAPGGTWTPAGGFVTEPNMPRGAALIGNKGRLWLGTGKTTLTNGTQLYLSDIVGGLPSWPAVPLYLHIGQGDGQNIVDLTVYYSDLVIFKQGSTYRFSYDSDPTQGQVTRVSDNIGATDSGCFASLANQLYVLFDNKVFQFSNYNYDQLNLKVPLRADNPSVSLSEYTSITAWSDRVFVAFFDKTFVYSLNTRSWSEWSSTLVTNIGRVFAVPGQQGVTPTAYTYSTTPRSTGLYKIIDGVGAATENMTCIMKTKNYDYQTAGKFKRLFWWGADLIARQQVTAVITPVLYSSAVTWDQLAAFTWDQIAGNTWDRPLDTITSVQDMVSTAGVSGGRKFIKFLNSLRFRQVSFKLSITTDGSTSTAPVRVYNLSTKVKDKQTVSKKIS